MTEIEKVMEFKTQVYNRFKELIKLSDEELDELHREVIREREHMFKAAAIVAHEYGISSIDVLRIVDEVEGKRGNTDTKR